MKKTGIFLMAMFVSLSVFPQRSGKVSLQWGSKKEQLKANEVKLNLATTIFVSYPEFSYERVLDNDISVGASAGIGLNSDDYSVKFALTPYFRWFFGGSYKSAQKAGTGFFIEANGSVFAREYEGYDYYDHLQNYTVSTDSEVGAGFGLAFGWKYLSENNWVGELYLGAGRGFVNDDTYPRFGISIGKRF